ncbi:MAG: ABC transporter permease [bacterium]|nr:ABC transporter permease [bacterium]
MKRLYACLLGFGLCMIVAPFFAPYDPMQTNTDEITQPPSHVHLLGTDQLGRDVLSRLLHGGQRTLAVAFLASLFAVLPGLLFGLIAVAGGKTVDRLLMVLVNAVLAFPSLLLALVVLTVPGQGSWQLALATGLAQAGYYARVARSAFLAVETQAYIESARAIGLRWPRLVLRYYLPNARSNLIGYAGLVFSYSIINSAALSFLGLGGEPGVPDWGVMLADGREAFRTAPWVGLAPGVAISLLIWMCTSVADRLIKTD